MENSGNMYGIYNPETIEKTVKTIEKMHNKLCGMTNYFQLDLLVGKIGINQNKELYIMP